MTGAGRRGAIGAVAALALIASLAPAATPARAAAPAPLFAFSPQPRPEAPPIPPPNGYLDGPCGVAVDSAGDFYLADHYHDRVDVYDGGADYATPPVYGDRGYIGGLSAADPCALAVDSGGNLYVASFHGAVEKFHPSAYPPEAGIAYSPAGQLSPGPSTGVAVDPATDHVFVDERTHISEYDAGGSLLRQIGVGSLGDGYGVAVSASGRIYVADAAGDAVKVYDPSDPVGFPDEPSATIDGSATPAGGFASLRDASLAVDRTTGDLYVVDDTQPAHAEQPRARVYVFSAAGDYLGHLAYDVVDGAPSGIAVDNSATATQGRVYVTSGNTHLGGVYAYPPGAATGSAPLAPTIPPLPPGSGGLFPTVPIGSPARPPGGVACEGDACQALPPEPVDPTLTTRLPGLGNPKVRYLRSPHSCRPRARLARRLRRASRRARRRSRAAAAKLAKRARGARRALKRCRRSNRRLARASASVAAPAGGAGSAAAPPAPGGSVGAGAGAGATSLEPAAAGFDAVAYAADGTAATEAGSHPYSLDLTAGLDQSGGEADLRSLRIALPPGLLLDPAVTATLCSAADFGAPRSSPFEASASGESCPERSQVGTAEVGAAGQTRRFGLFELDPAAGSALRLGAAPFGRPLVFDAEIDAGSEGAHLVLRAEDVPQALRAASLKLILWGVPWDASHNSERGRCLNEAEPGFAWCKSSVGEPLSSPPAAFLTLPTECRSQLVFSAAVSSWQQPATQSETSVNREAGGAPAPIADCSSLAFGPEPEGFLTVQKASSSSGFVFHLSDEDPGLADPRARVHAQLRSAVVELPEGVTLNPSLGAGLETCSPAQLAAESATAPPGAGCPNGSKIGDFEVRSPFYEGLLKGGIYLAKPHDNPYGTLLALYLIAKSADRDILITVAGKLVPDPGDGTLTATFEDLPQLPYADLKVDFRTGQRAPLVSPPSCGPAKTTIALSPWAAGAQSKTGASLSPISSGIDFGPCPGGSTPPFAPGVVAGGVNANVGSYTPYFVHLIRRDTEQEITSYSLTLPKGVTGKLAGIPFCPDSAIEAARHSSGLAEIAGPSCPAASRVGRTLTGYGVGPALTYADGRIYLAGPYHGAPLSLVTINAATVGPFDLGTIVVRSAFDVDPLTAQLSIDSSASDPIPHIIDGVPLHLRDVRVYMDRPQFTHNPSSCEPSQLESTLSGSGASFEDPADDSTATVSEHFQLLNCLTLGFRPKLGLRLRGSPRRGGYPALRASFVSRGAKDSNLRRIEVDMPHQLFLAQSHIRGVCTRVRFAAGSCPPGSVYGRAVAQTPLLDEPLRGNVYLRSSTHKLPDLVTDLRSGSIRIVLEGRIGPSKKGGIQAFFDNLPDAPIERFTMLLRGGRHGLLTNSVNVCRRPPAASVKALAQNNIGRVFTSRLRGQCHAKKHRSRTHHRHRGRRGQAGRGGRR